ncbi:hypothetical protein [Kushneria indalinina]|uniref:Uncharacterized protein n=1 Tax=Kushneria indalinina DSM 14324 TaxID=1122140 RepID=A0A3D9E1A4_9GAMM|nr:hypothetical protein [Kushneria indalinina]REC96665.1 hypothetical protein C8D72_0010 [Kushneria indalinina DSM 14324]
MQDHNYSEACFAIVGKETGTDFEPIGPFNSVEHAHTYVGSDSELTVDTCRIVPLHAPAGQYTVILRRPDYLPSSVVESDFYIAHANADDPGGASEDAQRQAVYDDGGDIDPDDYAVIAVFIGHITTI